MRATSNTASAASRMHPLRRLLCSGCLSASSFRMLCDFVMAFIHLRDRLGLFRGRVLVPIRLKRSAFLHFNLLLGLDRLTCFRQCNFHYAVF